MNGHKKHKDLTAGQTLKAPIGARKVLAAPMTIFVLFVANSPALFFVSLRVLRG